MRAHYVAGNCYNELNRLGEALNEYNACIAPDIEEAEYYFKRAIVMGKNKTSKPASVIWISAWCLIHHCLKRITGGAL